MGLKDIARAGDNRVLLEALRDRLALELDSTDSANDVARLSQRLVEVVDKLGVEPAQVEKKGTPLDELKARRQSKTGT